MIAVLWKILVKTLIKNQNFKCVTFNIKLCHKMEVGGRLTKFVPLP